MTEKIPVDMNDKAGLACYFWTNWSYYDLTTLAKEDSDYTKGQAAWNFCKYARIPENSFNVKQTFAFMTESNSGKVLPMTDNDLIFDDIIHESDSNNVTFHQDSDLACPYGVNETTSFTATIVCDKENTGKGEGKIISADYTTDPCNL